MIFDYKITNKKTFFNYKITNPKEISGMGETKIVKLLKNQGTIYFDYAVKTPHNDLMAFMFIIIFNPFIKEELTFKFPISINFIKYLRKVNKFKNIKILNTEIIKGKPFIGNQISIPIGGGIDSSAIMCMFNDTYLYHSTGKEKVNVNLLAEKCGCKKKVDIVDNNIKKMIKPRIFTHWVSVFIGAYLLAQDQKLGYLFLGTQLDSNGYIKDNKFNKKDIFKNDYRTFSKNIGIELVNVFNGCSAIINSKIICKKNVDKYITFCDKGKNGKYCGKCSKCFRKLTVLSFIKPEYSIKNYNDYDLNKCLHESDYKHLFLYKPASFYNNNELKQFIYRNENVDVNWLDKIYIEAYKNYSNNIRTQLLEKLNDHAKPMNKKDIFNFHNYDLNRTIVERFSTIKYDFYNVVLVKILIIILMTILILKFHYAKL